VSVNQQHEIAFRLAVKILELLEIVDRGAIHFEQDIAWANACACNGAARVDASYEGALLQIRRDIEGAPVLCVQVFEREAVE
jgi:hypothetical protein